MAAKEVKFEIDARTRMLKGVDILANAVKGNTWAKGKKRRNRQVLWGTKNYKRWRHCR